MKQAATDFLVFVNRGIRRSTLPITLRLNRSFFPADLISVRGRDGYQLDGVEVSQAAVDHVLKNPSGGGGPSMRLGPKDSIDFFVSSDRVGTVDYPPLRNAHYLTVRNGEHGVIWVTWDRVNGKKSPGEVGVLWTYEDRTSGKAPYLVTGANAKSLANHIWGNSTPLAASILEIKTRVPAMRRRDIKDRMRAELQKDDPRAMEKTTRVKSLALRGLRGFKEEAVLNLAQPNNQNGSGLTVVVGANNTGKSTIWESFDAVARKVKSDVSFSEGRRNRDTPGGVHIEVTFEDGSSVRVESRYENSSETKLEWRPEGFSTDLEIVSVPSRRQFQATFGRNATSERDWMTNGPDFTRFSQDDQFSGRLFDLHNNEHNKKSFDLLMSKVLGTDLNWTIELGDGQYGQSYYLKVTSGENGHHTSEGLGDGVISLLYILNALYDSKRNTLLVFDEPELSLHPQLLRRLGRVLAEFAKDRQIVVFTHSPLLVSWEDIQAGAEVARVYKRGVDSKIAQVSRATIDDVSKARGGWRNPHSLGVDANEALFLDDGVIVVEGQEDAALLPRAFELAGVKLEGTIFGWGAGGADNMIKIVRFLEELEFSRISAIFDNNVPKLVSALRSGHPDVMVAEIPAADIRDKRSEDRPKVEGLLSKNGKMIKDELLVEARQVFCEVSRFIKFG